MEKNIDLSIIIISFNNKELLKNCLNSIHENISNSIICEVFVVDNNSQDGSLQLLQECFPGVKVIGNAENLGFAKANNQALRQARGRYLVLLNSDTFVLGGCFEKLIQFLDENKNIGAVSPRLLEGDSVTTQVQGSAWTKQKWLSKKPIPVKFISGAAFMIRRETYKNVGGLDEKFFFYNEDLDWCKRIRDYGWGVYYYPDSAVIHYGGKSTGLISKRALVEGIRGGLYYCYKHYRWLFPLYLLLILIYALLEIILLSLKIIFSAKRKGIWERLQAFAQILLVLVTGAYK